MNCSMRMALGLGVLLAGCMGPMPVPLGALNSQLVQQGSHREPSLSGRWLALIANRNGRDQVELVDVERQRPAPLPHPHSHSWAGHPAC